MPISCRRVSFAWPDGSPLFNDLNFIFSDAKAGLVGFNGAGKSTLGRLLAGELEPQQGSITHSGPVIYFAQSMEPPDTTAAFELAMAEAFQSELGRRMIDAIPVDQNCRDLSGGEWMRVRLAMLAGQSHGGFVILDEPTNHLDRDGRGAVRDFIRDWPGGLIVISHDRELLEVVDEVVELSNVGLSRFGGGWESYFEQREAERDRLTEDLEQAKRARDTSSASRQAKIEKQQKRMRTGARDAAKGGMPKILLGARKRRAQASLASVDVETAQASAEAVANAHEAFSRVKVDPVPVLEELDVAFANDRLVFEAFDLNLRWKNSSSNLFADPLNFSWRGPMRVAIKGRNGSGKSTLMSLMLSEERDLEVLGGFRRGKFRGACLMQDPLAEESRSVLELLSSEIEMSEIDLRNQLARFLFPMTRAERSIRSLSGGERMRAALARILIGHRPEVLFLDEPSNNLDLATTEYLERYLSAYKGAIVAISHDAHFLEGIGITSELSLDR